MARRRRHSVDFAMDIAPVNLIDLVLILLIFFITTTTFLNLKMIELALPDAEGKAVKNDTKPMVISIDSDGRLYVDRKATDLKALSSLLKARHTENADLEVLIAADAQSRHDRFVQAVSAVKNEQITRIGIVTDLPKQNQGERF
jgi:biopolymer transport protein ExbD